jgi:2-amino-4-hydroxy-6-hydroxymethyldihydropteridine diphosphokinase
MNTIIILLGTNIGDRLKNLIEAIFLLNKDIGRITLSSGIYVTKAWGNTNQEDFYNQVIVLKTELNAFETLLKIHDIEQRMGRNRKEKWEPRIIDIDILYFNDELINTENLIVPHPHLHNRRFTLVPLVEIIPDFLHPQLKKTNKELLEMCEDTLEVVLLK